MRFQEAAFLLSILGGVCLGCAPKRASLGPVESSRLREGIYQGSCLWAPCQAKVQVTVAQGKVEKIEILRHVRGKGKPGEQVVPRILDQQSTQVDTVSGATRSSLVILHAVQEAIEASYRGKNQGAETR